MHWNRVKRFQSNGIRFRISKFIPFDANGGLKAFYPNGGYTAGLWNVNTREWVAFTMSYNYSDMEFHTIEACEAKCREYSKLYGTKRSLK